MILDSLHGAIFVLELLSLLNSVILLVLLFSTLYQLRELSHTCDQLKNWLIAQNRRSYKKLDT